MGESVKRALDAKENKFRISCVLPGAMGSRTTWRMSYVSQRSWLKTHPMSLHSSLSVVATVVAPFTSASYFSHEISFWPELIKIYDTCLFTKYLREFPKIPTATWTHYQDQHKHGLDNRQLVSFSLFVSLPGKIYIYSIVNYACRQSNNLLVS